MFYSKSFNCCVEARALVGCSAVTAEPCLGFTGDCADLAAAFAGVPIDGAPGVPSDYVCIAFPNEDSSRDSFLLGLISWACSLPVSVFILNCFWCANAPDYDPAWLRWDFQRRIMLGWPCWHYRGDKPPGALRRRVATAWGVNIWYNLQQGLVERPVGWLYARCAARRARRGEPPLDPDSRLGAGLATQIKMESFSVVGLCAVYLIWAIMAWIIFTYGSLVYRLMGDAAQESFTRAWGVGLAISQVCCLAA
jgi:hypothetical protein